MDVESGRLYVEQTMWDVYVFENGNIVYTYTTDSDPSGALEWIDKDDEIFQVVPGIAKPLWIAKLYEKVEEL